MLKSLLLGLCALSMAAVCAAQPAAVPGDGASAPVPRWHLIEARTSLRVQVHLLPMQFSQGRDTPVYTGYLPQLRFADRSDATTCTLHIPPGVGGELKPGERADASVRCRDDLRLREDRLGFQMLQGSRLVGEGQVLLEPDRAP